ncbi:two-component system activity regulator YycH, partial [Staphylococcus saprophyticus]|uniref:two-component system activity regulator YycH n=1 Tax=Staphylococcus saprophyticus TaxID=29385 RepID=UPI0028CB327E
MLIPIPTKQLIKSIILILLLLITLLLTYITCNFSPHLPNLHNQRTNTKHYQPNTIPKPFNQPIDQLITPYQLLHSKPHQTQPMQPTNQNIQTILN